MGDNLLDGLSIDDIAEAMETVYTFVMENYDNYTTPRDYGNGEKINMAEIHTLSLIAENPGIVVSDVATMWNRSRSAASQNINKLHRKGLIEKVKENGNDKSVHLYATKAGSTLSELHREYDRNELLHFVAQLNEKHSGEEIMTAFKVIKTGVELIENKG